MSRLQFIDLDTLSEEDEAGSSIVISKHEMICKLDWWKLGGMVEIKKEVKLDDIDKETTGMEKELEKHNGPPHE